MTKPIAAIAHGEDYQARVFWLHATRLLQDRTKVTAVEIEPNNIKSIDDVAVHYSQMMEIDGNPLRSEFFQVKFHMTPAGALTWEGLMDPAAIGGTAISFLMRVANAQRIHAPNGTEVRLCLYTPWGVHPDDHLAKIFLETDGSLRWEVLSQGRDASICGSIRAAWRKHLGINSDEELRLVLRPLRLIRGPQFVELGERLNERLEYVGLLPVPPGQMNHPYEGLARRFVEKGRTSFTRPELEAICKREGLWVGRQEILRDTRRLGVRSFLPFAEQIEDETDVHVCLLKYFNGRQIAHADNWGKLVGDVNSFLTAHIVPGASYLLFLHAHASIAFMAGYALNPKSGVDIGIVQPGPGGRQIWRPASAGATTTYPPFACESIDTGSGVGEVAIAISAAQPVKDDVVLYVKKSLPAVSRLIHFWLPIPSNTAIQDGVHAYLLAQQVAAYLKTVRTPSERQQRLHVFCAAPNGFTFFLGQMGHAFGPTTLYEYELESNAPGAYRPAMTLQPSR